MYATTEALLATIGGGGKRRAGILCSSITTQAPSPRTAPPSDSPV